MATDSRRERQLVWMGVTSRVISLNFCRARWDGFNARNGKVNREWLSLSSTPLNLKYPELKYNRLCVGKVFDGVLSPAQPLIRIWTGELNIWLDKVTVCQYENAPTLDKKSLYWPIHFVIGFSKTCYRTIVDIEVGDVLLISNNFAYAVIYNTKICDLIYPEELKMVDHFEYEEDFETDDFDIKKSEIEINDENDYQQINSFEDLPVKIEFVLGKKIMNLYEIDDLCAKELYLCFLKRRKI